MDKNKLFYKQRPYIYAALGIIAFAFARKSKLAFFSGLTLLICSFVVFELRKAYQKKLQNQPKKPSKTVDEKNKIIYK